MATISAFMAVMSVVRVFNVAKTSVMEGSLMAVEGWAERVGEDC